MILLLPLSTFHHHQSTIQLQYFYYNNNIFQTFYINVLLIQVNKLPKFSCFTSFRHCFFHCSRIYRAISGDDDFLLGHVYINLLNTRHFTQYSLHCPRAALHVQEKVINLEKRGWEENNGDREMIHRDGLPCRGWKSITSLQNEVFCLSAREIRSSSSNRQGARKSKGISAGADRKVFEKRAGAKGIHHRIAYLTRHSNSKSNLRHPICQKKCKVIKRAFKIYNFWGEM